VSEGLVTRLPHQLVFTGHRIDAPDRFPPRFPARIEPAVRNMIRESLRGELERAEGQSVCGISSAANGGDILFLELCAELGIGAEVFLAVEAAEFCRLSVEDAGQQWADRFYELMSTFPVHILPEHPGHPLNVWQRTNLWMLETAVSRPHDSLSVVALWDGNEGDGQGGTKDMIDRARLAGAEILQLNPSALI
jgi:hypothetical protein